MLSYHYSSKFIIYKNITKHNKLCEVAEKLGVGKSTLFKQIEFLKTEGLIEENKEERYFRLISNKDIEARYGTCKSIYADSKLDYKKLKLFFKNIKFYSNLASQQKQISKKQHLNSIIGKFYYGVQTAAETTKLMKFGKKCNVSFNDDVNLMYKTLNFNKDLSLSTHSHAKLLNRKSHMTSFNHKRKLSEQDPRISFQRQYSKRIKCSFTEHYEMIQNGELPPYAKRRDGMSYYDLANKIIFDNTIKSDIVLETKVTNLKKSKKQEPGRYLADTHNLKG